MHEISHEQMAEGERQAQEVVIHANLDENCSPLDADQTRRGKVSILDATITHGAVSPQDAAPAPRRRGYGVGGYGA